MSGEDAIKALSDRGMAWDLSRQLLSPGSTTPPPAKVPGADTKLASSAAQDALKAHMAQYNLTSTITTRNNDFYDYKNNVTTNGIISNRKVRNEIQKWARKWNQDNPNDTIDLSVGDNALKPFNNNDT